MDKVKHRFLLATVVLTAVLLTGCTSQTGSSTDSGRCDCPSADLDCADFSSHEEAQDVYDCCLEVKGSDTHRLDRDSDGLACETSN